MLNSLQTRIDIKSACESSENKKGRGQFVARPLSVNSKINQSCVTYLPIKPPTILARPEEGLNHLRFTKVAAVFVEFVEPEIESAQVAV